MKLTDEERTQLAERLLEVVPDGAEIEAAWMAEAQRRFAEHDAGNSQSVPVP
jgi:putative addiction module component (TIGR02574 family)